MQHRGRLGDRSRGRSTGNRLQDPRRYSKTKHTRKLILSLDHRRHPRRRLSEKCDVNFVKLLRLGLKHRDVTFSWCNISGNIRWENLILHFRNLASATSARHFLEFQNSSAQAVMQIFQSLQTTDKVNRTF